MCLLSEWTFPFWLFCFGYFRLPLSGQTFKGDAIVAGWGATLEGGQINGTLLSAQVGPAVDFKMQFVSAVSVLHQYGRSLWLIRLSAKQYMEMPSIR